MKKIPATIEFERQTTSDDSIAQRTIAGTPIVGDTSMNQNAAPRRRDRTRIVAWTSTAVVGLSLSLAAVVYKPAPDIAVVLEGARFMIGLGLVDQATEQLNEVLRREPDQPEAELLLANVDFQAGRYDSALARYDLAREWVLAQNEPGKSADLLVASGALRLHAGKFAEAQQDADLARSEAPDRAAPDVIWAFSRLGRGDEEGFRYGLARAFELAPFDPFFRIRGEFITEAIPWATAFVICDWPGRVPRP